jgi:hypothetical protein
MTRLTYQQQEVIALLKYDNSACYAINRLATHYDIAADRIELTDHQSYRLRIKLPTGNDYIEIIAVIPETDNEQATNLAVGGKIGYREYRATTFRTLHNRIRDLIEYIHDQRLYRRTNLTYADVAYIIASTVQTCRDHPEKIDRFLEPQTNRTNNPVLLEAAEQIVNHCYQTSTFMSLHKTRQPEKPPV